MTTYQERLQEDLKKLIREGELLEYSMLQEVDKDNFMKQLRKRYNEEEIQAYLKSLPVFQIGYEAWYSESLALLKQVLPDRVANFTSFYEKPKSRKSRDPGNYVIQDYFQGLMVKKGDKIIADISSAIPQFRQQLAILKAAAARFQSSLFDIKQLVQADLFDNELEVAKELLKNKYLRAAGAMAGVVLENHLKQVCDTHSIKITKKDPDISFLNELLKLNSVYDIPQWRYITRLGDIRNLCCHKKHREPTATEVEDLIKGTSKVLKTVS